MRLRFHIPITLIFDLYISCTVILLVGISSNWEDQPQLVAPPLFFLKVVDLIVRD